MREKLKRGVTSDVVKKIDVNESADQKKWVKNGPFSYRIVLGGPETRMGIRNLDKACGNMNKTGKMILMIYFNK